MEVRATDALHFLVLRTTEVLSDGTVVSSCMRYEDTPANRETLRRQGLRLLPDPALSALGRIKLRLRDRRRAQSN